ncbi:MAG: recombinase family protein [Lachnospiraceae bacterium]|nr:recombinase family protein [Lachnospiraceae bacterium]
MRKNQCECQQRAIAIYSRKSKFTGVGESIENQIELCKRYIENLSGDICHVKCEKTAVEHKKTEFRGADLGANKERGRRGSNVRIYEDEGFSGGNLDRPQFKAMMQDARQGKLSKIVVYRLDRISRNIGDFAGLIEELNRLDVSFVSIKEQFDTSSPMGRAMMYIASVFSQLERETIAERIRDNMLELAKTGRWLGGRTPTGYASESVATVTVDGRTKKCCKLKVIPEEAELVREIFRRYLECRTLKETAEGLNREGRKTKTGKSFTSVAVRAILSNPVYAAADEAVQRYFNEQKVPLFLDCTAGKSSENFGLLAYNRTLQRPGKTNQIRGVSEWIVAAGKHEPIISGKDWVQVQKILQKNGEKSRPGQTNLYL